MPSEYCILEFEHALCAVDMPALTEVVTCPPVTFFPGGPPGLLGVINLRGDVLPLFRMETMIGLEQSGGSEESVAVLKDGETVAAFPIRHVQTVVLEKGAISPHPDSSKKRVFLGRFEKDGTEVVLLDVSALMSLLASRMEESKSAISSQQSPAVNP